MSIGLGAAPGAATGKLILDADTAAVLGERGTGVILARTETSAEDVHGMAASSGVLTSKGGATSHAAVVARGLGKPCVTGAEGIEVNVDEGWVRAGSLVVKAGEDISIDGATGEVFAGAITTVRPRASLDDEMATLLDWADERRTLGVWANADGPVDAAAAVGFGAEGIGLCRTEHMFFDPARLPVVQTLILSAHKSTQSPENDIHRARYEGALAELEELQTADFEGIFREMGGRPVVVRLLDPPLHEFLPRYEDLATDIVARRAEGEDSAALADKEALLATVGEMREANPMLGLRGCRVGILYPEIYGMQARAIVRAARSVAAEGVETRPEIMVPLVSHANELAIVRRTIEESVQAAGGALDDYPIGVMIETPRAALTAGEIAESAEFFSFGTNDLTQTAFAFSRDDAEGKYLAQYVEHDILNADPFQTLDTEGVGALVRAASDAGRRARPGLSLGICGEHGGDPASIAFFHEVGLDYVSCSPYRVPVARLAAAQAALRASTS
jgi:pyruvate,orthophosphate dikinase